LTISNPYCFPPARSTSIAAPTMLVYGHASMCGKTIYAQSSHLHHCSTLIHIPPACCNAKHVACHLAQAADAFFSNQSSGIRHPRSTSLWEHHFFSFLKERLQLQLLAVTYYQVYHIRPTYSIKIRYILQPFSIR